MKHFINNKEITPKNVFDIGVQVDFSAKIDQNKLTTDKIILPNEGMKEVLHHKDTVGVFEGLPYHVELQSGSNIDMYIDLTSDVIYKDTEIECTLKQRFSHDNFFDNAEGLSFELIHTKKPFTIYDVGFQLQVKDQLGRSITLSLAIYSLSVGIAQQVKELSEVTKEFVSIAGYGFSAIGKIIEAGLKLILTTIFLAVLVFQAYKLIQALIEINFPKTRYLKGSKVLDLIQKGCDYLGYTFESSILENEYKDLMILPIPINKTKEKFFEIFLNDLNDSFTKGYPTANDTTPTLGSLISAMESKFNAETKIINGKVTLERWDYWIDQSSIQIQSSLTLQDEAQNSYKYDFSRLFKRYLISYQTDYSDLYTIDNFENSNTEYSLERENIINNDLNSIKGLTEIQIPFSLASIKTEYDWLEKRFSELYKLIDKLAGTNYANKKNKLGLIILSDQFYSVTKLIMYDGNKKQSLNYNDFLSASKLWEKFHYINNISEKPFLIIENEKVKMNDQEFINILNKNYVSIDGSVVEITNIQYFPERKFAVISYKKQTEILDKNIKLVKVY